ncbi:MAG: hypothetical protein KJ000_10400 [Pirellulaceae bacterium]|nr:hypothetical protein [Pirellulaceae bacterium]
MTKRERFLAAIVGSLFLLGGLMYGISYLSRTISDKRAQALSLEGQIRDKQRTVRLSMLAADRLTLYERRSLPPDLEKARSLYQTWLLKAVTDVGLSEPIVNVVSSQSHRGLYHQLGFTVSGRGDLKQLTELLYAFYKADYLHRIRRLSVKRIQGSRQLDIAIAIEAVSLPTATHLEQLSDFDSGRLAHGNLEKYLDTILARNLSGPPNQPPAFESISDQRVNTNSSLSFTVRARDPDRNDQLRYWMEADGLAGAEFDRRSGQFRWRPSRAGEYRVTFHVSDDGFPSMSASQRVRITVTDPPPPPATKPPETIVSKPSFAMAKFVYVTAITESAGRRQAWISLRTEGKTLKLHEGDEFNVGQVPVTVRRIEDSAVELESAILEKRIRVTLGKSVAEGDDLAYSSS